MLRSLSPRAAFAAAVGASLLFASGARAEVIYSSIPNPLPGNVVSLGYQATSTSQFGDLIQFGGTSRTLNSATVTMSDWAKFSDYPTMNPAGWNHPLTLSIYNVNNSGPTPTVGSLISSTTVNAAIPWHNPANGFNGTAFNVKFALPNVLVPNQVIFGISYNTQSYGTSPLGTPGPYNSLNVGLLDTTAFGPPSVGTDVNPDAVFWNTSFAGFYTDGGAGGVGTFRQDTNWSPYTPAIQFEAADPTPEPATMATFALMGGFAALGYRVRRKKTA